GVEMSSLERGAVNAYTERLSENERIAGPRSRVSLETFRVDDADHDQAINRLDGVDCVATGDGNSGGGANGFAAVEDVADRLDRQLVDRHADERQREERRRSHRVDVRDRVRRGDPAEVERIVDDRHEEVRRRDD